MNSNKCYALLVFDWDGTLMDSAPKIVDSFHHAIADLQLAPRTDQEIAHVIGLGLSEAILVLYPDEPLPRRDALMDAYRQHYLNVSEIATPLFATVAETLQTLHARGYQLAVATGKSRRGLDRSLSLSGLSDLFAMTRCAEETRSKPDPLMLQDIMHSLNYLPAQTLMIGDSEYDLAMAVNAGVASLAVSYGVHDCQRLLAHQPLACIHQLNELLEYV